MKTPFLVLAALAVPCLALAQQPTQAGRWITESGNLEIDVAPCGDALCGTVVRVLADRSMSASGQAITPADPRPALGMVILSELRATGEGELSGRIYNRENAKHYSVRLAPVQGDQMALRAYLGLPILGKTQVWKRP